MPKSSPISDFLIIYEDNHIIALNKPANYLVQGDKTGDKPLSEWMKDYLKSKYNKPGNVFMGVAHRLDRPVSGVLLFAKTSKALTRLNQLFKDRGIRKIYWALTEKPPKPESGYTTDYLLKDQKKNKTSIVKPGTEGALKAELSYKTLRKTPKGNLIEIEPKTGRPHQIRVQMAALGAPIIGDLKYGAKNANPDASICLHAREIRFIHPVKKVDLFIKADIPDKPFWTAAV